MLLLWLSCELQLRSLAPGVLRKLHHKNFDIKTFRAFQGLEALHGLVVGAVWRQGSLQNPRRQLGHWVSWAELVGVLGTSNGSGEER